MAVILIKDGFNGWKKFKPNHLSRLPFDELQPNTVLEDSFIQGMVVTKWNVHKYKNSKLLKVVIQEVIDESENPKLGSEKLGVFILGDVVEKWEKVNVGDYVCLSDVSVELGPNDGCRIALEENETRQPLVWVLKKEPSVAPKLGKEQNQSTPEKTKAKRQYTYTALKDLQPVTTVNVWGVVKFFRRPTRSRGTDFSTFISLTDPSLECEESRVSCLLFAKEERLLPTPTYVGQIVRFHRLRINFFNGRLQGRSGPGFAWQVYDSTDYSNEPVSSSSPNATICDADGEKLKELRDWLQSDSCPITITSTEETLADSSGTSAPAAHARTSSPQHLQDPAPSTSWQEYPDVPAPASIHRRHVTKYTCLKDLKHDTKVNVIGVITFIKSATRTSKNDFLQVISIVDPSVPKSNKLKCLLFADRMGMLLNDALVGQMVCFHSLNITRFGGALQGQRGLGFSWALFDCLPNTPVRKIMSSVDDFSPDAEALEQIKGIREWAEQNELLLYQRTKSLSTVEPDQYFDLICQVVSTCELDPNICMLLRVWDGTEPFIPIYEADTTAGNLKVESDPTLIEQAQGYITDIFVFDDHFASAACLKPSDYVLMTNVHALRNKASSDVEKNAAVPRVELCLHGGTAFSRGLRLMDSSIDMIASELKERLYQKFLCREGSTGENINEDEDVEDDFQFMGLPRKRSAAGRSGSSEGIGSGFGPRVKRTRTSDSESSEQIIESPHARPHSSVNENQSKSDEKLNDDDVTSSKSAIACSSERPRCLQQTATGHHHIPVSPLEDVIKHVVPYKFRVRVQLVGYQPEDLSSNEMFCLHCSKCESYMPYTTSTITRQQVGFCPNCRATRYSSEVNLQKELKLTLTLADSSGWLTAYLHGEQADKFFAHRNRTDSACSEVLRSIERLCPSDKEDIPPKDRPWMECCIASYKTDDRTCYEVFDTMIADEEESL